MSEAVQNLRAKALGQNTVGRPLYLVLNDELRETITQARDAVAVLTQHREELAKQGNLPAPQLPEPVSLADAVPDQQQQRTAAKADIDRLIESAQETVKAAEKQAIDAGEVVVLQFRRLSPAAYEEQVQEARSQARQQVKAKNEHRNYDALFLTGLSAALLNQCYLRAETIDGEDLGISIDELRHDVMSHGDEERAEQHAMRINRTAHSVDFTQASFGRPATN